MISTLIWLSCLLKFVYIVLGTIGLEVQTIILEGDSIYSIYLSSLGTDDLE